jgi:hypothetical protein
MQKPDKPRHHSLVLRTNPVVRPPFKPIRAKYSTLFFALWWISSKFAELKKCPNVKQTIHTYRDADKPEVALSSACVFSVLTKTTKIQTIQ